MPVLSIVSTLIRGDLRSTVDFVISRDFRSVELHGKHHSADELADEEVEFLKKASSEHGLTFNLHFLHGAQPASHRASVQKATSAKLKRDIELVGEIGGSRVTLHPGMIDVPTLSSPEKASEVIRRESLRNLVGFVEDAAFHASGSGVDICLENMHHSPGSVIQSYEELANLVGSIHSENVGVTLDVGHALIGDGLKEAIDILGAHIRHLHLNDAIDGVEHQELGTGILDFDELKPIMIGDLDIKFAVLELGGGSPDAEGTVIRSRDALRSKFGSTIL